MNLYGVTHLVNIISIPHDPFKIAIRHSVKVIDKYLVLYFLALDGIRDLRSGKPLKALPISTVSNADYKTR